MSLFDQFPKIRLRPLWGRPGTVEVSGYVTRETDTYFQVYDTLFGIGIWAKDRVEVLSRVEPARA